MSNQDGDESQRPAGGSPPSGGATSAALFLLAVFAVLAVAGGLTLMVSILRSSQAPAPDPTPPVVMRPAPEPRPNVEANVEAVAAPDMGSAEEVASPDEAGNTILEIVDIPDTDPNSGCGIPRESGYQRFQTVVAGQRIKWVVYVPQDYESNHLHPVIIHNASRHRPIRFSIDHRGFKPIADREGVLLLGIEKHNGRLPSRALSGMRNIVEDLHRLYCVDRQRLYSVGVAKGERDTRTLANHMELSGIAGSGNRLSVEPSKKDSGPGPNVPIPYMRLFGSENGEIPRGGGMSICNDDAVVSFEEDKDVRRKHHGCSGEEVVYYEDIYGICKTWQKCEKAIFVMCEVDGGREWPGEPAMVPGVCGPGRSSRFPYAEAIWKFWEHEGLLLEPPQDPE